MSRRVPQLRDVYSDRTARGVARIVATAAATSPSKTPRMTLIASPYSFSVADRFLYFAGFNWLTRFPRFAAFSVPAIVELHDLHAQFSSPGHP
jgi:hypothetical protein